MKRSWLHWLLSVCLMRPCCPDAILYKCICKVKYTTSITTAVSICRTSMIQATDGISLSISDITTTISLRGLVLPIKFSLCKSHYGERQTDESSFPFLAFKRLVRLVWKKDCFYSTIFSISLGAVCVCVNPGEPRRQKSHDFENGLTETFNSNIILPIKVI